MFIKIIVNICVLILFSVNLVFLFFVFIYFIVFDALHSWKTSSVVIVVVVRCVAIFNGVSQAVKEIESGILIIGFYELVDAVDDARRGRKRGKFAVFDTVSSA